MSKLLIAASFVLALTAGLSADDKAAPKIEGQYTLVSCEKDGKPQADDEIAGRTVRITADKIVMADKEGKELWAATYTLDDAKKPCVIKMKGTGSADGKEFIGLVERTANDQVRVCFCEGTEAPAEFKIKDKGMLCVLKPTAK